MPEYKPITAEELERWATESARRALDAEYETGRVSVPDERILALVREVRQLHSQLPESMQHCTIRFIECEKGHGRLLPTNWLDHGCSTCALEAASRKLTLDNGTVVRVGALLVDCKSESSRAMPVRVTAVGQRGFLALMYWLEDGKLLPYPGHADGTNFAVEAFIENNDEHDWHLWGHVQPAGTPVPKVAAPEKEGQDA